MSDKPSTAREELLSAVPSLRAFAISLCGDVDRADDLVQETLLKAWSNLSSYSQGTNMRAWLFTILRNNFYSQFRKRRREVQDVDGVLARRLAVRPEQPGHMQVRDFKWAFTQLPPDQREALVLVQASTLSYKEVAEVCGCAVGTVKSRVSRARSTLAELMELDDIGDLDLAPETTAAISRDPSAR